MLFRIIKRFIVSILAFLVWLYFVDASSYFVFGLVVAAILLLLEFGPTRQMFVTRGAKHPTRLAIYFRALLFAIDAMIWPYQILFNVSKHRVTYAKASEHSSAAR